MGPPPLLQPRTTIAAPRRVGARARKQAAPPALVSLTRLVLRPQVAHLQPAFHDKAVPAAKAAIKVRNEGGPGGEGLQGHGHTHPHWRVLSAGSWGARGRAIPACPTRTRPSPPFPPSPQASLNGLSDEVARHKLAVGDALEALLRAADERIAAAAATAAAAGGSAAAAGGEAGEGMGSLPLPAGGVPAPGPGRGSGARSPELEALYWERLGLLRTWTGLAIPPRADVR